MFDLKLFEYERGVSLCQKGWQFSFELIAGRNVKDLSLENVYLILVHQKGWQFSCHLMTGRKVKDLSLECFTSYCLSTKVYTKRWQISCPLITGRNVKDSSLEMFYLDCKLRENKC